MPELIFEGDWNREEAEAIASSLQKSFGIGDGEGMPEDLVPPVVGGDWKKLLSKAHQELLEQWQQAGRKGLPCMEPNECPTTDEDRDWGQYALKKALFHGMLRRDDDGDILQLNENRRWEKVRDASGNRVNNAPPLEPGAFQFPYSHGEYGHGVYLPIDEQPTGYLRLRARLDISPEQAIMGHEFYALEDDLTGNTGLMLDSRNVRAILTTEGDRLTQICIRHRRDIQPLGIVGRDGKVPTGKPEFRIVALKRQDNGIIVDIEMQEPGSMLAKTAWKSSTPLNGTPLRAVDTPGDRPLLRKAIARCKRDGLSLDGIQIKIASGIPDFMGDNVHGFCLPSEGIVWMVPHDIPAAIARNARMLSRRLKSAVRAGAMPGDAALDLVANAAEMTPEWWLEHHIKFLSGCIRCERAFGVLAGGALPSDYLRLLLARGFQHWGDRRLALICMGNDFRLMYDPAGLPNCATLEWDVAVPSIARMSQSALARALQDIPSDSSPRLRVPF